MWLGAVVKGSSGQARACEFFCCDGAVVFVSLVCTVLRFWRLGCWNQKVDRGFLREIRAGSPYKGFYSDSMRVAFTMLGDVFFFPSCLFQFSRGVWDWGSKVFFFGGGG